ncbi:MAG: SprT-like domain-containing protein [Ichthyobacteriaceae bacterium]|nr:SprT-like domain-containing protein [Ichthyobacteriaceae bacterium]
MRNVLEKYFPENHINLAESIIKDKKIHFVITPGRKSKIGDYRNPHGNNGHKITVNGNLNKYAFAFTFYHEYAHLLVWESYKNKVAPHGAQWKQTFSKMLQKLLNNNMFPDNLIPAINNYSINPKASTDSDIFLSKALKQYNTNIDICTTVFDLENGQKFMIKDEQERIFIKGEIKRTRVWCKELKTNSTYAFNPNTEVVTL